jgi:hypothetical protein
MFPRERASSFSSFIPSSSLSDHNNQGLNPPRNPLGIDAPRRRSADLALELLSEKLKNLRNVKIPGKAHAVKEHGKREKKKAIEVIVEKLTSLGISSTEMKEYGRYICF